MAEMKGVTMNKKITALIRTAAMPLVSGCSEQNGSNDSPVQAAESSAHSVDSVSKAETSDKPDNATIIDSLNNGIIIDEVSGHGAYKNERKRQSHFAEYILRSIPPRWNMTEGFTFTARTTNSSRKREQRTTTPISNRLWYFPPMIW